MNPFFTGVFTALTLISGAAHAQQATVSASDLQLQQAIAIAVERDPWFSASRQAQRAEQLRGESVAARPAPSLSLSMLNLPTDTFSVHQEPMTQLRVGVSQAFTRGDTVALTRQQHQIKARRHPAERREYVARIALNVTQQWLDYVEAVLHEQLIGQDINVFEQMVETTTSAYQSGLGEVRQQDVIDARLALAQLEEQLTQVYQQKEQAAAALTTQLDIPVSAFQPDAQLPGIALPDEVMAVSGNGTSSLVALLVRHPSVQRLAVEHDVAAKAVGLAKQKNAPQWAVNGSYGYRDDARTGESRADFFSVGVSVDVPLFNQETNDNAVKAAFADAQAIETRRRALIRDMLEQVNAQRASLSRLYERRDRYEEQILPQSTAYAEATLDAYTAAQGSVETVLDARTAHLKARIAALNIDADIARTRATLAYFTTTMVEEK